MTLPRPTRDWTVTPAAISFAAQGNITATNVRAIRLIVAGGVTRGSWTIDHSCDGTTAGTKGDGVDRWVDDAAVVGNTPGNAHSWSNVTLHGGMGELVFDRDASGDRFGSIWHSPSVGFTGGTTTVRPTATDEVEVTQSTSWLDGAANGNISVDWWICTTALQQGTIVTVRSTGSPGGPVAMMMAMRPTTTVASLAASPPPFVRWQCTGAGASAGDFSTWAWHTRVSGTNRTMSLSAITPQSALDVDGNRVLEPAGASNATINTVGWLDDFLIVASAVTDNTTYSDEDGTLAWIIVDSLVLPWDRTTARTSNSADAVLNVRYTAPPDDAAPPTVTMVTASPIPGTYAQAVLAPISFTVDDVDPGVQTVFVTFLFASGAREEVVYRRGAFRRGWSGQVDVSGTTWTFTVNAPAGGWPGPFTIGVDAVDASGNENA